MLIQIMENLIATKKANDEARETWLALIADGGEQAADAMHNYHAAQGPYEKAMDEFVPALQELKEQGTLSKEIGSLQGEMREQFDLVVRDLRLEEFVASPTDDLSAEVFIAPSTEDGFASLVESWFQATATLDAAVRLNDERLSFDCGELDELIARFDAYIATFQWRDEAGWKSAIGMYRDALAALWEMHDVEARMSDATHAVVRRARAKDDQLCELVRDALMSFSSGELHQELLDLPDSLRHRLQRVMDAGFLPQPQVQIQTKPDPRPWLEDVATETDIAAEVETWLRGLSDN